MPLAAPHLCLRFFHMKTIYHPANTRGQVDFGWLKSAHSFSFGHYYDPQRMGFGMLRVLNDDVVSPGMGFGTHPHENMEIISIPLEGALEHKDSMGHVSVLKQGEIQVMSAGTGIQHSEYNHSKKETVSFLQLWIIPNAKQVQPRYDQQSYTLNENGTGFTEVVGPKDQSKGLWIHQQAWLSLGQAETGQTLSYTLHQETHGLYIFIIEGSCRLNDRTLNKRDGLAVWDTQSISLECQDSQTKVLLIETPLS